VGRRAKFHKKWGGTGMGNQHLFGRGEGKGISRTISAGGGMNLLRGVPKIGTGKDKKFQETTKNLRSKYQGIKAANAARSSHGGES